MFNIMKVILVVGSGAREYMIIKKLIEDSNKINIPINIICINTQENTIINDFCYKTITMEQNVHKTMEKIEEHIHFCIIGPEEPLEKQYADYFEKNKIPCIGPLQFYAQLETSKYFCRDFLSKNATLSKYSPKFICIDKNNKTYENIKLILDSFDEIVIKKDGLCGGKGVTVQGFDFTDKDSQINYILNSDDSFIIEEKLVGEEFSVLSMTDGLNHIQHFPPIQDNKRLLNDDKGPNTGGMGCVIDKNNTLSFLTQEDINETQNINTLVIQELNSLQEKNNLPIGYRGILYGSYIKTKNGIHIIEYNCRFGDPECIIALSLLETNFYSICLDTISGNLCEPFKFSQDAMICLYLVPKNYPKCKESDLNYDIYFEPDCIMDNIINANIKIINDHNYSQKSRSLCYISKKSDLYKCYHFLYNQIKKIKGNLHYRTDIGSKFLTQYEQAGVSIENGESAISKVKKHILSTYNKNITSEIGSFGGEYKFKDDTLVASIDGVGTKSSLTKKIMNEPSYYNIGKDIVGHSVNDILTQGAYPLFFLDYFGTDRLSIKDFEQCIQGMTDACLEYGKMPIIGGETAEMPLVYRQNEIEIIGCIIGVKNKKFFPQKVKSGDIIVSLPSVSPHTNGYSLINYIIENGAVFDPEMINILLKPHKCYLNEVKLFTRTYGYDKLNAMAHITGGGLISNLKRVLPLNLDIELYDIEFPEWCNYLMKKSNMSRDEMFRVFNCGVGFVFVVDKDIDLNLFDCPHKVIGTIKEKE